MIVITDEMMRTCWEAIDRRAVNRTRGPDGKTHLLSVGLSAVLESFVRQVEGKRGFGLCDCDGADSDPTRDGNPMDHHCDCRAVATAAALLGAYSKTVHAKQCGHGTEMDEFYEQWSPAMPSSQDGAGNE
jgi:hypothetical protein